MARFQLSTAYGKVAFQMMGMNMQGGGALRTQQRFQVPGPAAMKLVRTDQRPAGEKDQIHIDWVFDVEFDPAVDAEVLAMWLYANLKAAPKGWVDVNGKVFDPTLANLKGLIAETLGQ